MPPDPREADDLVDDFSDAVSTFGDRLGFAREAMGLSQAELAHRIGVKPQTLRNWEEDRAEPRANRLQLLAGMLNAPMVWLMSGQGAGPAAAPAGRRSEDARDCLGELRRLRAEQARIVERMARLEKRLRAALEPQA
jgi:transcriptional regulator with XRE-family HTH domain